MKLEAKWMSDRFEGTTASEHEIELRKMAALERIADSLEGIPLRTKKKGVTECHVRVKK